VNCAGVSEVISTALFCQSVLPCEPWKATVTSWLAVFSRVKASRPVTVSWTKSVTWYFTPLTLTISHRSRTW